MLIKFDLQSNSTDAFVPFTGTKQEIAFLPKEESYVSYQTAPWLSSTNSDNTGVTDNNIQKSKDAATNYSNEPTENAYQTPTSAIGPTDYIGAWTIKTPFIINPDFADIKFLDFQSNGFATLSSLGTDLKSIAALWKDLYAIGDTSKLATVFNGQQFLRIPANCFNTIPSINGIVTNFTANIIEGSEIITIVTPGIVLEINSIIEGQNIPAGTFVLAFVNSIAILNNPVTITDSVGTELNGVTLTNTVIPGVTNNSSNVSIIENIGKYYIKISPKYVDLNIISIRKGSRYSDGDLKALDLSSDWNERRTSIITDQGSGTTGLKGSPWNFEAGSASSVVKGRLLGSICEIWEPGMIKMRCQKTVGENFFDVSSGIDFRFVPYPDLLGYDGADQFPQPNDIVRIYPRETYFDPIFIEINYIGSGLSLTDLIRFIKNDASRDVTTGIIEIFDENGLTVDGQGNVNGNVIQAYQIFQNGNNEIRKELKI